jgi:hypothetical protein
MATLKSGSFTEFAFYSTNNFNKKVFNKLLIIESVASVKAMRIATEQTCSLVGLCQLMNEVLFKIPGRIR